MAQVIVRPVSNVSSNNISYSSGSSAYPLINEATADGDSSYVALTPSGTVTVKCNAPSNLSRIQTINSITIYAVARINNHTETIRYGLSSPSSSYGSSSISGTSYATFLHVVTVNNTPANFDLNNLNIFLTLYTSGNSKSIVYVTQMYVVIDYVEKTIISYVKIDGTWHLVSKIYVKINGVWKEVNAIYDKISGTWHTG